VNFSIPPKQPLLCDDFERIRMLDTRTTSNVIGHFDVPPRNEGFVKAPIYCRFSYFSPALGYAATARICFSFPPTTWPPTTRGCAHVGEMHTQIATALKCIGCVTNGAVRNPPAVETAGFHHGDHYDVQTIPLSIAAEIPKGWRGLSHSPTLTLHSRLISSGRCLKHVLTSTRVTSSGV